MRKGGLKPQHHCRGAWKQQEMVTKSTQNLVPIFFFFLKKANNLGGSYDVKQRKKRGWPYKITSEADKESLSASHSESLGQFKRLPKEL